MTELVTVLGGRRTADAVALKPLAVCGAHPPTVTGPVDGAGRFAPATCYGGSPGGRQTCRAGGRCRPDPGGRDGHDCGLGPVCHRGPGCPSGLCGRLLPNGHGEDRRDRLSQRTLPLSSDVSGL